MTVLLIRRFTFLAVVLGTVGGGLTAARPAPVVTTGQLVERMTGAIENLRYLRCSAKIQERLGREVKPSNSLMKLSFKPFRVYLKDNKNVEAMQTLMCLNCCQKKNLKQSKKQQKNW